MNPPFRSEHAMLTFQCLRAFVSALGGCLRASSIPCFLLLIAAAGCTPDIEPDGRAVLWYVRNAQVGAPVRRLWPEGQAYVDEVLKTQATYRQSVEALDVAEDLWPMHSEEWQSAEQIDKRITEFNKLLGKKDASSTVPADDALKDKEEPKSREELLQAIRKAAAEIPAGMPDSELRELALEQNVWSALGMPQPPLTEAAVSEQLALLEAHLALCKSAKEALDGQGEGLAADQMGSMHADLSSRILAGIDRRRVALQAMQIEMETLSANRGTQLKQEKEAGDATLIRDLRYDRNYADVAAKHAKKAIESLEKQAKKLTEEPTVAAGATTSPNATEGEDAEP